MADRYRQANGTWNDGNWYAAATGGSALGAAPGDGDTVYLNGKTVALDVSTANLTAIYAGVAADSTGNGTLTNSVDGVVVNAVNALAGQATLIMLSGSGAFTFNGILTASFSGIGCHGLSCTTARTVTITQIKGGGTNSMSSYGVNNSAIGASFTIGTIRPGLGMDAKGFRAAVLCTLNCTSAYGGLASGGPGNNGVYCSGAGTFSFTNLYGQDGMDGNALRTSGTCTVNITNCLGNLCSAYMISGGFPTVTIVNCTGGLTSSGYSPYGVWIYSGTPTIKIAGGVLQSGPQAYTWAIYSPSANHTVFLENATVIDTDLCRATNTTVPYHIIAMSNANFLQIGTFKFPLQLGASNVKKGVVHGDRTGTLVSGGGGGSSVGGWTW